ncbi:hypothetical protein [Methanospirillum lacunae]|uniref:Uncharacterized protein n=1 Tax=Methanospirillum lacunae TaxID=668570 RepID=A0A2V2NDB5_9EURY|nr:hypothetical protein [Methanospirillum lacunae]PWR74408.1 hypothetical protein DK846_04470 [Methanospirillum lacunae]
MPKWLDTGSQLLNLDYIAKFQVIEMTREVKGQVIVEKAVLKAMMKDGEQINIAAFKNRMDAVTWMRTRLRNSEEKVIQVR